MPENAAVKQPIGPAGKEWAPDKPVRPDYLVFGSPQLLEADIEEVVATLRSGWIGTGVGVGDMWGCENDLDACRHNHSSEGRELRITVVDQAVLGPVGSSVRRRTANPPLSVPS